MPQISKEREVPGPQVKAEKVRCGRCQAESRQSPSSRQVRPSSMCQGDGLTTLGRLLGKSGCWMADGRNSVILIKY